VSNYFDLLFLLYFCCCVSYVSYVLSEELVGLDSAQGCMSQVTFTINVTTHVGLNPRMSDTAVRYVATRPLRPRGPNYKIIL